MQHKFEIGQNVYFRPAGRGLQAAAGAYRIVQRVPETGSDPQYRIKSVRETHERMAMESQLTRAAGFNEA